MRDAPAHRERPAASVQHALLVSVASPRFTLPARLRLRSISFAVSIAVGGGLALSGLASPLPRLPWAGAFLCVATQQDIAHRRIPNGLTFPAVLVALALQFIEAGAPGVLQGLLGLGLAFLLLFLPYAARGLGAGDVKATMVLGALWGPQVLVAVLVWMAAFGGAFALAALLWQSISRTRSQRAPSAVGRPVPPTAMPGPTPHGLPLAPVIGSAVISFQQWGTPWYVG